MWVYVYKRRFIFLALLHLCVTPSWKLWSFIKTRICMLYYRFVCAASRETYSITMSQSLRRKLICRFSHTCTYTCSWTYKSTLVSAFSQLEHEKVTLQSSQVQKWCFSQRMIDVIHLLGCLCEREGWGGGILVGCHNKWREVRKCHNTSPER